MTNDRKCGHLFAGLYLKSRRTVPLLSSSCSSLFYMPSQISLCELDDCVSLEKGAKVQNSSRTELYKHKLFTYFASLRHVLLLEIVHFCFKVFWIVYLLCHKVRIVCLFVQIFMLICSNFWKTFIFLQTM